MDRQLIKIAEHENYNAHVELLDGLPFLHVDVSRWSKSTMKDLQDLFDRVLEKCEELGIDTLSFYGTKDSVRLSEHFGELEHLDKIDDEHFVGSWKVCPQHH